MPIIHKDVTIGHIHLTVGNLDRALLFYKDILGFEETARYGNSAVFLSAGGYHHHIALNTWQGEGAILPPLGHTGLYHFAILYPTRRELAYAYKCLVDAQYPITGTADHGVSEAIYLNDPDGNGVELYVDKPREQWKVSDAGTIAMDTLPFNVDGLLAELDLKK